MSRTRLVHKSCSVITHLAVSFYQMRTGGDLTFKTGWEAAFRLYRKAPRDTIVQHSRLEELLKATAEQ